MSITPPEDQAINAWYESQSEQTLRDLQDRCDAQTPRQAWEAFFKDCPPPAHQSPGESLAAPASAVQEVCTRKTPAEKLQDLRREYYGPLLNEVRITFPAPDFVLIRACDLKHVLMMWTRAIEMRGKTCHTEKTALDLLRNRANSAQSLGDFIAALIAQIKAGL